MVPKPVFPTVVPAKGAALKPSNVRHIVGVVAQRGDDRNVQGEVPPAPKSTTPAPPKEEEKSEPKKGFTAAAKQANLFKTVAAIQRFKSASSEKSQYAPQEVAEKLLAYAKRGDWNGVQETIQEAEKHGIDTDVKAEGTSWTPLHYAAKDNQATIIESLLKLGYDVNSRAQDGVTPLHLACAFAREDTIRVLLAYNADPMISGGAKFHLPIHILATKTTNAAIGLMQLILNSSPHDVKLVKDGEGNIPLHLGAETNNYPIMGLLLTDQVRSQLSAMRPPKGDTVLHMAVRKREFDMIKMLMELGSDVNHQNDEGQTVIHIAAEMGEERLVKYFCARGGNPDIFDNNDQTAVSLATKHGHINLVELLTEKYHASVSHRSKDGSTLLHLASNTENGEAALIFMKKGVPLHMPNKMGAKCIHMAAFKGHAMIVKELIKNGERVDCRNNEGYTPLHLAVKGGQPAVVECLLGLGADVNLQAGKVKESPLHISSKSPNGEKCADMLIKSGANVNAIDNHGESPLHVAARHGNVDTVKFLLRDGADTSLQSAAGENVLHIAVRESNFYVAKAIIEHIIFKGGKSGVKTAINQQNKKGESSVHYATELNEEKSHFTGEDRDIMKLLLNHGGDVVLEASEKKETPIHYCSRSGNTQILQEMIDQFGDLEGSVVCNKAAKYGWTPLFYACYHGHPEIIKILITQSARIDVFDENGEAPLHVAVENGHEKVVDILLEHNAFVNVRNKTGLTPLHLACKLGYNEMVRQLITEHGALIDAMTLTKQTPLHLAAQYGQLEVCRTLMSMRADMNAIDNFSQTPLHLSAENDHADVLKMFLDARAELVSVPNRSGYTCAHIAATKGSLTVIKELMKFNRDVVISARVKKTGSTTLHLAAEGGHAEIVKLLLQQGSKAADENAEGMTALHLAAKHGHVKVLHAIKTAVDWKLCSRKTGLTAIHVAAASGQADFVGEMLRYRVPGGIKSERPGSDPKGDYGITPLHLASKQGHENVVRMLLNSAGVSVDQPTEVNGTIPMHLAAQGGHLLVAGLLISRSTEGLTKADKHGRTVLHLAASHGHRDMASLLLGQGAQLNAQDNRGWTPLHYCARHGYIEVVRLLTESGADPTMTSKDGKVPLCCAAGAGHQEVLSYLLKKEHDTFELMDDKNFLIDLMVCAKQHDNRPIQEYVLVSAAPIDTAVKLAKQFESLTEKEKDRAKDLQLASEFCDQIATDLLSLASQAASAGALLRAVDHKQTEFLDVLLELERKEVVSQHSVQKYLSGVWMGQLTWAGWKFLVLFVSFLVCPPVWVAVSCPIGHNLSKVPVIKFMSYLTSHVFFIILLTLTTINPWIPLWTSTDLMPHPHEWGLLIWIIGIFVSDITNPTDRAGLGGIKVVTIWFGFLGIISHCVGFIFDEEESRLVMLYIRNQLFAVSLLLSFVEFLNFLTFHHLFGPWAVIIRDLIKDLLRFLAILGIFMVGFSLHVSAIYVPVFKPPENENATVPSVGLEFQSPLFSFEMLFFSLFGLVEPDYMPPMHFSPAFAKIIMKLVFAIYMMVTVVVLINLLIAMMSNTYSRIEAQSDTEWKFGRAKLIRNMIRTSPTPSPLIIFVGLPLIMIQKFKDKRARERGEKMAIGALSRRASVSTAASKAATAWVGAEAGGGPASSRGSHATLTPSFGGATQTSAEGTVGGAEQKKISEVVNWKHIVKKYWEFIGVAQRGDADDDGSGEGGGDGGGGGGGEQQGGGNGTASPTAQSGAE